MNKKTVTFLGLLLASSLTSIILTNTIGQASSHIEATVTHKDRHQTTAVIAIDNRQLKQDPHLECEPYGSHTAEIIASATDSKEKEHVLWKYTRNQASGHTDAHNHFLIQVTTLLDGSVCGVSYEPTADEAITDRIELNTARYLSPQLYQHLISEAGGQERSGCSRRRRR